mmetsp:Transcript_94068/g.249776  ORF Transcript_94068/g.249776 Transcript_94068/m.249776 type:complete len:326 (-) Transcript_94068:76-1053(-)
MPGALRVVAPAYAALAPDGCQGPWLPEPCAKRAWPDSAEEFAGNGNLGVDAFEGLWEPCPKRPRLRDNLMQTPHCGEAVSDIRLKRPTLGAEEDPAKRRRVHALALDGEQAVAPNGSSGCFGEDSEEESSRRVARKTQASALDSAPAEIHRPDRTVLNEDMQGETSPSSSGVACIDVEPCSDIVPCGAARILSFIRDSFIPRSPDFHDAQQHWPLHLDRKLLQRLGTASGGARRFMAMQADEANDSLPGLVVFRNGHRHMEPMDMLIPQADEPELPGFIIYSGKRRPTSSAVARAGPSPQYSLREFREREADESDEEEETHPMVI